MTIAITDLFGWLIRFALYIMTAYQFEMQRMNSHAKIMGNDG